MKYTNRAMTPPITTRATRPRIILVFVVMLLLLLLLLPGSTIVRVLFFLFSYC